MKKIKKYTHPPAGMQERTIDVLKKIFDFRSLKENPKHITDWNVRDLSEFSLKQNKKHSSLW